jgi:hypothetical protein
VLGTLAQALYVSPPFTDQSNISCREKGEWNGYSTENGVDEVAFLANGVLLQAGIPDPNGFVVLPLDQTNPPAAMTIAGNAGEMAIDLTPMDQPLAPAAGSFEAILDGDGAATVTAVWSAESAADVACVSTTTAGSLSKRCCAADTGSMVVETRGMVDAVGLERFNDVGSFEAGESLVTTWQTHGIALEIQP